MPEEASTKKLNLTVDGDFSLLLNEGVSLGRSALEVTKGLSVGWRQAMRGEDAAAAKTLRDLLAEPTGAPFEAEEYMRVAKSPALAIHMGVTRPVDHCPFRRDFVGIDTDEMDPFTIVERTFAEWRLSLKTRRDRRDVINYKVSRPVAMYRNVTWAASPDELPNGVPGRHNKGRHFVEDAQVTLFGPGLTYTVRTTKDEEGFIRPEILDRRPWDQFDPVLAYVASHQRQRPTVQMPVDLLGM